MRPLTAYHIFFQIEREYIIQTTPGSSADSSIHAHKQYLPNVPAKYSNIKLSHDWYAGPGKRSKRKHRKSHGKIGFLELSRVVSGRWANLEMEDPETKRFVTGIAKRELDEYKREMQEYEEMIQQTGGVVVQPKAKSSASSTKKAKLAIKAPVVPSSTSYMCTRGVSKHQRHQHNEQVKSLYHRQSSYVITPPGTPPPLPPLPESVQSSGFELELLPEAALSSVAAVASVPSSADEVAAKEEEVDYSISIVDSMGHHIPSSSPSPSMMSGDKRDHAELEEESLVDPLFELKFDEQEASPANKQRHMVTRCNSMVLEVEEMYKLWSSQ
jgi:hypothetical protein